jgi:hypothetical protein
VGTLCLPDDVLSYTGDFSLLSAWSNRLTRLFTVASDDEDVSIK